MAYGKNGNGKGPYTPEGFPGYKCLPKSHMPKGSGKMSSAHGTGKSSPTKGMMHASKRIGASDKRFGHNFSKPPKKID